MTKHKKPDFARKLDFKVSEAAVKEHNKKKRKNPNLGPPLGFGADPNFLPDDVRKWLAMHAARSSLSDAQQEKLITYANQIAQMPDTSHEPIAIQNGELKKIAANARRLRNSLNALSRSTIATLELHTREAPALEAPCPIPIEIIEKLAEPQSLGILDESWEWISALEAAAEHALSQQRPSKQAKPKEESARSLVANLASYHVQLTGSIVRGDKTAERWSPEWCDIRTPGVLPPKDAASWFAKFAVCLGQHMGLEIGPRIVRSGIEMVGKPGAH